MHGTDTTEPIRSPLVRSGPKPVAIDAFGVADAVAQTRWNEKFSPLRSCG